MVGDQITDVGAGHRAGTKAILLSDKAGVVFDDPPEFVVANLLMAAECIRPLSRPIVL